jgi:hypothetical protein
MSQQTQEGFNRSVEDAQAWMKAIHERLEINDNTHGPRAALEARLRETEVCRGLTLAGTVALAMSSPPSSGTSLCFSNSDCYTYILEILFKCSLITWVRAEHYCGSTLCS